MRRQRLLAVISTAILILSQLLIPSLTLPSPAQASGGVGWTKYASNPVFTRGAISGAAAVIYDSGESIYKMWYMRIRILC